MTFLKRYGLFISFLFGVQIVCAQTQSLTVDFYPTFNEKALRLDTESESEGDVKIDVFRLYISSLQLKANGETVFEQSNSYHYLDFSETDTVGIQLSIPENLEYEALVFNVGIDSTTNVSGAMGGDLDPTNGMYWTWQSGYINFKLEGTAKACPARKNKFQFHLGGYASPLATVQQVELSLPKANDLLIQIDLDTFLADIDLSETYQIMRPSETAVALSEKLPTLFSIAQ